MASVSALTVVPDCQIKKCYHVFVKVVCTCGTTKFMRKSYVDSGKAKSCGCRKNTIKDFVTYNKRFMSLAQACKEVGINKPSVYNRMRRNQVSMQVAFNWYVQRKN
jgi:dynactin complex subunit